MTVKNKQDLSISMLRANLVALVIGIPVAILQLTLFVALHGTLQVKITWDGLLFFMLLLVSIVVHELIHGLTGCGSANSQRHGSPMGFNGKR